jgi:hypothetical protein
MVTNISPWALLPPSTPLHPSVTSANKLVGVLMPLMSLLPSLLISWKLAAER